MNSEAPQNQEKRKRCPACNTEFTGTAVVCKHDGTLLIPIRTDTLIGAYFAEKYFIESEIGRGGMSIVYKARHELMDRTVAIKMLQGGLVGDQNQIARFHQEAKAASCLTHPNVITVYDSGTSPNGQPYLVMDFLVGESLSDLVRRLNHLDVQRTINIFLQACDALEHAHQKGVLHRDLKSSNIMLVDQEGRTDVVKVVDFGIAKLMPNSGKQSQNLTQTGEIFGSPIYMSPEQCLGSVLDKRSDIYSMGAMLYETLTGRPPLMGDTIIDTMQMHVSTPPPKFREIRPDLSIPIEMERIAERALQKSADDRYGSMQEFRDALVFASKVIADRGYTEPPAQPRSTRQNMGAQKATAGNLPKPMLTGERSMSDSQIKKAAMSESQIKKAISADTGVPKAISVKPQYGTKGGLPAAAPTKKPMMTMAEKDASSDGFKLSPMIWAAIGLVVLALVFGIMILVKLMSGPSS